MSQSGAQYRWVPVATEPLCMTMSLLACHGPLPWWCQRHYRSSANTIRSGPPARLAFTDKSLGAQLREGA